MHKKIIASITWFFLSNKREVKIFAVCFFTSFFFITIFFEWLGWSLSSKNQDGKPNSSYASTRFRTEGTAVELYAEDIWKNGRRTLKTDFDPLECTIRYRKKWLVRWSEVECVADDESGRKWKYKTRYSDNLTSAFFMPFFVDTGPARELKIVN